MTERRAPIDPRSPPPIHSGWDANGHTFEDGLKCKCGKTLKEHNKNPWACYLTIKRFRGEADALIARVAKLQPVEVQKAHLSALKGVATQLKKLQRSLDEAMANVPKPGGVKGKKDAPAYKGGGHRKPWTRPPGGLSGRADLDGSEDDGD